MDDKEYRARARQTTQERIDECKGNLALLTKLLGERQRIARIYRNDGALHTELAIHDIDCSMIEHAIKHTPRFIALGVNVKYKNDTIARASSTTFAKRIANALNGYTADSRGQ